MKPKGQTIECENIKRQKKRRKMINLWEILCVVQQYNIKWECPAQRQGIYCIEIYYGKSIKIETPVILCHASFIYL